MEHVSTVPGVIDCLHNRHLVKYTFMKSECETYSARLFAVHGTIGSWGQIDMHYCML